MQEQSNSNEKIQTNQIKTEQTKQTEQVIQQTNKEINKETDEQKIDKKRKKIIETLKNFFTQEVEEEKQKTEDKTKTSKKIEENKIIGEKKEEQKEKSEEQIEIDMQRKRQEFINFIKKKPINLLYILFILLIPIGYLMYKSGTSSFFLLDIFIPFPINKYGFVSFFLILPIVSCTLLYYKKQAYIALLYIINSGFAIRLQNLPLLKDITTGKYVPLALDPHVFLRYAKYLLEHGKFYAIDSLRYQPFGANMEGYNSTTFLSRFIVFLHKIFRIFNSNQTIEFTDVIYPPVCFAISLIFFFLIVKNLFNKKIAIISTFILCVVPTYLYRTMAGFSDKESLGLMFMFITFYFFILSWKSEKIREVILFGLISGIATGLMGLTWGGVTFVLLIFGIFTFTEILLKKFRKTDYFFYISWIMPMTYIMAFTTNQFGGIIPLLKSFTSGIAYLAFLVATFDFLFFKLKIFKFRDNLSKKLPLGITSTLLSLFFAFIGISIFFGPSFILKKISSVFSDMINPFGKTRWALTVAESHQPYFTNWISDFQWSFIIFFFIGSIILFYYALRPLSKKESFSTNLGIYSAIFALFLIFFSMSRYSRGNAVWNGETILSKTIYIGSFIFFLLVMFLSYLYLFYFDKNTFRKIESIEKKYIFILIWFIIMLVAARSALRLILMLAPITSILTSYFIVFSIKKTQKFSLVMKDKVYKYSLIVLMVFILIIAFWPFASLVNATPLINKVPFINRNGFIINYAALSMSQAKYTGPSYDQQWQLAGKWIRENTSEDAVFGHWWDYGYWVQTGGERATVGDGGNWIGYWNHLMGRHALMGENQTEALEFLNMHNVTHFLIIADEIGKIGAYSSIGSDENYDRYTFIPTFSLNNQLTKETREGMILIYEGVTPVDEDFEFNGVKYYARQAAVKDVYIPIKKITINIGENKTRQDMQIMQPYTLLFQQNQQPLEVPLKCLYYQDQFIEFDKPGLNNCFMVIPTINNQGFDPNGAGLYLGNDAINSVWVNLFLFEQKNTNYKTNNFKLALSQQHPILDDVGKQIGFNINNVALYNGRLFGPLKVWEVNYPENLTLYPEYLHKSYQEANMSHVTVI